MTDKPRFFYGYIIVIASFFIMMLVLSLSSSFGVFFKPITEDLGFTRTVTSGAFSLSNITAGLAGIVMGRFNDRFGPRMVITLCGLLSAAGYLLMSQVQTAWQLYLFFGVMIGASGMVYVPLLSTVARWFIQRRGMMTGIVLTGSGIGMMVMPLVANWLIEAQGWRTSFVIMGVIVLIVAASAAQLLKRDPAKVGQAAYGENNSREIVSNVATKSLSFQEAIRNAQFWLFLVVFFVSGFYVMSIQVHIVPYATDIGISTTAAAAILATFGGASIVGQIALGHMGDRIGYKQAFLIGVILTVLAVSVLLFARELWTFYLFAVILGLAFGDCCAQESPIVAWLFGLASHGLFLGFAAFSFTIGGAIGLVISGYIFDVTGDYQLAFFLFAALSIIAVILTIFLKSTIAESNLK